MADGPYVLYHNLYLFTFRSDQVRGSLHAR